MDGETAARYRKEAERLRREAEVSKNGKIRQQLLALAYGYDGLAQTVETIARQRGAG